MKTLIGIGMLQIAIVAFLVLRTFTLEAQIKEYESLHQNNVLTPAVARHPASSLTTSVTSPEDLRTIIQEELSHLLVTSGSSSNEGLAASQGLVTDPPDPYILSEIESEISALMSDGKMSPADMIQFEDAIVSLQPPYRQQMMNRLTKSMNAYNVTMID